MTHRSMKVRAKLAVALSAAAVAASLSAGAVFAGEITGSGKFLPINANSECAFSGLDAHGDWPGPTQSWGQLPKADKEFLTSIGSNPGIACNGRLNPLKG